MLLEIRGIWTLLVSDGVAINTAVIIIVVLYCIIFVLYYITIDKHCM
jgi:hypothetical protein